MNKNNFLTLVDEIKVEGLWTLAEYLVRKTYANLFENNKNLTEKKLENYPRKIPQHTLIFFMVHLIVKIFRKEVKSIIKC